MFLQLFRYDVLEIQNYFLIINEEFAKKREKQKIKVKPNQRNYALFLRSLKAYVSSSPILDVKNDDVSAVLDASFAH